MSYKILALVSIVSGLLLASCSTPQEGQVQSPDQQLSLHFQLSASGQPEYSATYKDKPLIAASKLGYRFRNQPELAKNMEVKGIEHHAFDNTWKPLWGQQKSIRNHYNELLVKLREKNEPNRKLNLRFRVYDDGLGFRYELQPQDTVDSLFVTDEMTQFRLTGDHTAWWIPADFDSYEYLYEKSSVSKIDASKYKSENNRPDRQIDDFHAVNTPVTMKTDDGVYLSFHEAALTDYPDMTLGVKDSLTLQSELVPWADGITKVKAGNALTSPWRTLQVADSPAGLAASRMILNLNEPSKLSEADSSWIRPMKYTGIWWEMHLGKTAWGMGKLADGSFGEIGGKSKHGATTENALRYIDFTADAGIKGMLIEGWNTGWEYWGTDSLGFFDFTTPYPDFDLKKVADYAHKKGVALIGHHETSGQAIVYDKRLEPAFKLYQSLGVHAVKTGYAGGIVPKGEHHHGQWMVRHYRRVVKTAAKYHIAVDAHEPIKDTGIRRTWPNMMTREGVRGMEYNAWSDGNPPEHTTILPFTRVLGGPIDYTPGIFDIKFDQYRKKEQVHSTLANQLALYVVLYSPMQMAADLPSNYRDKNGDFVPAFKFIQDVAVDWDQSKVLDAVIGDYVVTARKEKSGNRWFLGAVTDENERTLDVPLDFLDKGATYKATIYRDGKDADWKKNPTSYKIDTKEVTAGEKLSLWLAPGGGTAIEFTPVN